MKLQVFTSKPERARRAALCARCPLRTVATQQIGRRTFSVTTCGGCGCPLASRTHFQAAQCPDRRF